MNGTVWGRGHLVAHLEVMRGWWRGSPHGGSHGKVAGPPHEGSVPREEEPAFHLRRGWTAGVGEHLGKGQWDVTQLVKGDLRGGLVWRPKLEPSRYHIRLGFHSSQTTSARSMVESENPAEQQKGRRPGRAGTWGWEAQTCPKPAACEEGARCQLPSQGNSPRAGNG